jgi:membrane protease subunit (stomatin/prohibitin family)
MSEIRFSDNHHDLSKETGFQFEFYCEGCHDAWRAPFTRYAPGTVEGILGAAEGVFGGLFGAARNAVSQVGGGGWQKAHDEAFGEAVKLAKDHFHRCPRCANHFCDGCWNADEGTCAVCVPRLDAELAAIHREAKLHRAREVAFNQAIVSEEDLARRVVSCPGCSAPVGRARFCPECGTPVSLKKSCGACAAEIASSAKFCPECGEKT